MIFCLASADGSGPCCFRLADLRIPVRMMCLVLIRYITGPGFVLILVSTTEQTETLYFRRPGILIFDPVAGVKIAQRGRVHGTRIFIERDSRLIHTRESPKIRGPTPYSRQLQLPSHIPPHDCTKRHCWLQNITLFFVSPGCSESLWSLKESTRAGEREIRVPENESSHGFPPQNLCVPELLVDLLPTSEE